jgi:hypothetical protein
MTLAALMALGLAIFAIGWLVNRVRGWGLYLEGAGLVIYLVGWLLSVLHVGL